MGTEKVAVGFFLNYSVDPLEKSPIKCTSRRRSIRSSVKYGDD